MRVRLAWLVFVGALFVWTVSPARAGNITLTGHDDDFHSSETGSGAARAQATAMLNFARGGAPTPSLPVLSFDAGSELTTLLTTIGVPFTNINPNTGVPAASNFDVTRFSAIVVASDQSCGGCDNNATSSTNINGAALAIKTFVNAGGGVVAFAGADNGAYYSFLPASASGFGNPPSSPYVQTAFGGTLGIPAVNGDPTHNFFFEPGTGGVDPLYGVVERFNGTINFDGTSFVDPAETIALGGAIIGDVGFIAAPSAVPEPTTMLLFDTMGAGLGLTRWRQRRKERSQA